MSNAICEVNHPILRSSRQMPGANSNVLFIDGHACRLSAYLSRAFPAPEYRVQMASSGPQGLQHIRAGSADVVVLCLESCTSSELEVYHHIRRINARIPVIVVAGACRGAGPANLAIEAMKQGAYDFLFQPVELPLLQQVIAQALDVACRMRESDAAVDTETEFEVDGPLVGSSSAMREVYKAIGRVASQDVPVLITGESGTGKELVARAIHQHGQRAEAPFLAINCAAIPETLLESELFGHEKGAFTGADRRRLGKFEQCNGGTLLLDEIGDMPSALQAKMLRVLQDQAFERVGGNETIRTNVRLIASTHRDLKLWSGQGKFRHDLYYRLGVFTIQLPPLRHRGDDLPMLVRYYLRGLNRELSRDVREVAPQAMERLRAYSWPGNVRELQSVMKQALLRSTGSTLLEAFLPDLPRTGTGLAIAQHADGVDSRFPFEEFIRERLEAASADLHSEVHLELDRILLPAVLRFTSGNQHQAAKILGSARQTLRLRLRDLGIGVTKTVETEDIKA